MFFIAEWASDLLLKPSVPSMISFVPSGFFDTTEHLWLVLSYAT